MKIPMEEYIPYRILALIVLAVFYGIYLTKQYRQKCRGIQTMQIGRGKDEQTHTAETLMGVATVGIIPAQLLSIVFGWSHLSANARFTGFCVGISRIIWLWLFFSPFLLDGKSNDGEDSSLSAAVHCGGRLVGFSSVDKLLQGLPVNEKRNSKLCRRFCGLWVLPSVKQTHSPAKTTYRERMKSRKIVEKLVESKKGKGRSA